MIEDSAHEGQVKEQKLPSSLAHNCVAEAPFESLLELILCRKKKKKTAKMKGKKRLKTYNSEYSLVFTHLPTNPPVRCLNWVGRTGSLTVSRATGRILLNFRVNCWQKLDY